LLSFFFLRDGHKVWEATCDLMPMPRERTAKLFQRLVDTVWAVFYGTVLVALLQGALIGGAYAVAGLQNWLVLAVLSFVMAIIPLLGAPVVYFPVAIMLLLQGDTRGALIVGLFGSLFVSNIDNVIKPFLIGGRSNLHPLPVFFSILGGVLFFGPIGVMAGPMTLTLALVVLEEVREQVRQPAETEPRTSLEVAE
jgi:predicted PurR-regulated permease PerM